MVFRAPHFLGPVLFNVLDYKGLNKGTTSIKNHYPLPLINETLTQINQAKKITKRNFQDKYCQRDGPKG